MKLKLDENLPVSLAALLSPAGHDVSSVVEQQLGGCSDESVAAVCAREGRILVTLDLDFANPLRFPPAARPGLVILRPRRNLLPLVEQMCQELGVWLNHRDPSGQLWIVEAGRLRIFAPEEKKATDTSTS